MDRNLDVGSISSEGEHPATYYRGFFSAARRRPVVEEEDPSILRSVVRNTLFLAIPFGFFWLFQRYAYKYAMSDMKSVMSAMTDSNKNFRMPVKDLSFKEVLGVPEAKIEVQQYVEFLRDPSKFARLGARMPRGCLLTGPPGTGKTMLAKAVAGEANVPFFSCSGSDFIEVYLGSGPKAVRKLFEEARAASPSIVFIDEIDAIGSRNQKQAGGGGGAVSEENRTINQLLAEMDGLSTSQHTVVVFAATNYAENIDQALMREGRFDRKVDLPLPDRDARVELFEHYLKKIVTGDPSGNVGNSISNTPVPPNAPAPPPPPPLPKPDYMNPKLAAIMADLTPGLSAASIAAIVNEAAIDSASKEKPLVDLASLKAAIDDVLVGKKHRSRMTNLATKRVALHECGHTLVAWMLPSQRPVLKVSIEPRGQAAGFTQQAGREALDPLTHLEFFTNLCVMLGGRHAESMRYTDLTTGAVDDLQRATEMALTQFLALGMSVRVGRIAYDRQDVTKGRLFRGHSRKLHVAAEHEAKHILEVAAKATKALLEEHKDKVFKLAEVLVEKKELDTKEIEAILGPRPKTTALGREVMAIIDEVYIGGAQTMVVKEPGTVPQ
eukprot:PhM_4_TR18841/c0_g1_i1/m.70313/K08956/AFG3; AFG3 family protein